MIQVGGTSRSGIFELKNNTDPAYQMVVTYAASEGIMVTFTDETSGWTAWGQTVKPGDKIALPKAPEKEGFVFRDWTYSGQSYQPGDIVEINKTGISFTAHYSKKEVGTLKVTFLDHNGNTLFVNDKVKPGETVAAPSAPVGYIYTWNSSELENIKEDKTIRPSGFSCADGYIENGSGGCEIKVEEVKFTVRFFDTFNGVMSEQSIVQGSSAVAPQAPTKDKYQFTGWDKDFSNVQSNLDIYPVFGACSDPNGDINNGCEVSVPDPEQPDISTTEESSEENAEG